MSEPRFDADAFLRRFWQMDRALVAAGFPAVSDWWKAEITRFVRGLARGVRRWVMRAGRRAGKSTTLSRLAVAWAWFGPWFVPPGDTAVIPFVSVSKDESGARLRTISAIAKALGLDVDQRGDELELLGERTVLFRCIACTTSAVVGFTSIAVFGDEVARWESRDTAANPAREVVGSLGPTLATQPFGFMALCSSPWGTEDYHAELFAAGDTDHQVVSFAPTWIANPTITEGQTHELEPDQRIWSREYAAEPGATVSAALDPEDVAACFAAHPPTARAEGFVWIDASSLRGDAFAWLGGYVALDGQIVVVRADAVEGDELRRVSMADVVARVAVTAQRFGTRVVHGDQREEAALQSLFAEHRLMLKSYAWSEPSKDAAMQRFRQLMRDRKVFLPEHDTLKRELTQMKARLVPSGRTHYGTNGLDYASALVTGMHAIVAGDIVISGKTLTGQCLSRSGRMSAERYEQQRVSIAERERTGDSRIFRRRKLFGRGAISGGNY